MCVHNPPADPAAASWASLSSSSPGGDTGTHSQPGARGGMEPESHHPPEIYVTFVLLWSTSLLAANVVLKLPILFCFSV